MKFKRRTLDLAVEENIITGMIVSDQFLTEIRSVFHPGLLESNWTRLVASWCLDYFDKYQKAPEGTIQEIYNSFVRSEKFTEEQEEIIGQFLQKISDNYAHNQNFNVPYVLDQSEHYLKKRSLIQLKEDINAALLNDDVRKAEHLIGTYKRISRPHSKGVEVLKDQDALIKAFNYEENTLLELGGVLGEFIGPLSRGDFLGIFGPAGRGKSWWLLYFAVKACMANLNVLFFNLEMTEDQIIRRIFQFFCGETLREQDVLFPVLDCFHNQCNECRKQCRTCSIGLSDTFFDVVDGEYHENPKDYIPCKECKGTRDFIPTVWFRIKHKEGIDSSIALRKQKALNRMFRSRFHLATFPGKSISINDAKTYADNLEVYDGFIMDVGITDYADFFGPVNPRLEFRHQINETWEGHRSWGQERHSLIITGSHTNKQTFSRKIQQGDSQEDTRKMNHLTKAIALNQKDEEKIRGIMRLGNLKKREEGFSLSKELTVLQQLHIGRPYLTSFYETNYAPKEKKEKE